MSKCKQCGVIVRDDTEVCPLCKCVLDTDTEAENKYPDIWAKNHVLKLIIRIYLFVAIVTESLLIYLNYIYFDGLYWSAGIYLSDISLYRQLQPFRISHEDHCWCGRGHFTFKCHRPRAWE